MVRTSPHRLHRHLALAALALFGAWSVAAADAPLSPRDAASPLAAANPMFPDDAAFTAATVDPPLTAIAVKSLDLVGMNCAGSLSYAIHLPNLACGDSYTVVADSLLTFADQNLRLRI